LWELFSIKFVSISYKIYCEKYFI